MSLIKHLVAKSQHLSWKGNEIAWCSARLHTGPSFATLRTYSSTQLREAERESQRRDSVAQSHTMSKWQSYEASWGDAKYSQGQEGYPEFIWEEASRVPVRCNEADLWMSWMSIKKYLGTQRSK